MCCDLAGEGRGGRGASVHLLEQLRGIGRKCAFYNGFTGSVPTKFYGNAERAVLVSRFDNLGKGASGAAIQNMNVVIGCAEDEGLV